MRHHLKSKVVKGGQGGRANPSRNHDHHPPFIRGVGGGGSIRHRQVIEFSRWWSSMTVLSEFRPRKSQDMTRLKNGNMLPYKGRAALVAKLSGITRIRPRPARPKPCTRFVTTAHFLPGAGPLEG